MPAIGALARAAPVASGGSVPHRRRVFNIMDWHPNADGETDDHTIINNAIDSISALGGGILYFPAGSYRVSEGHSANMDCSGSIHLKSGVHLMGDGMGRTIIRFGDAENAHACIVADRQTDIGCHHMDLASVMANKSGSKIYNNDYVYYSYVHVYNGGTNPIYGISLYGCRNSVLDHCLVEDCSGGGIALNESYLCEPVYAGYEQSNNCQAIDCTVQNSGNGFRNSGYQVAPYSEPDWREYPPGYPSGGGVATRAQYARFIRCTARNMSSDKRGFTSIFSSHAYYEDCNAINAGWAEYMVVNAQTVDYVGCMIDGSPISYGDVHQSTSGDEFNWCGAQLCTGITVS